MTNKFALNFDWNFCRKQPNTDIRKLNKEAMEKVSIPHSNVTLPFSNFSEELYQFESIYQKDLLIHKKPNYRYFINFEGVLHQAIVYLNGTEVTKHLGGYTSFEIEITDVAVDGINDLIVEVDSRETLNIPPFGKKIDYLTFGGIHREVSLIERPNHYIKAVEIGTKNLLTAPEITFNVETTGGSKITLRLIHEGRLIYEGDSLVGEPITLKKKVHLWDLDHPNRYQVEVILDDLDNYQITTGFREAEFTYDGFYLNGKKIKIHGLNRHQSYPYVGYAMPKRAQRLDAELMKKTGNAVRTSHYPQSHHFIDACDELGLLVFTEAPGWQHIGDQTWKKNYLQQVEEMVTQYKHHPSIILWGVRVNESGDDHDLYEASNKLAKSLDQRQTGGVRCFNYSETLEDVYTYNDFFHNGTNDFLKPINQILKTNHPYLITEFNGHMFPTKSFDHPKRQIELVLRYASIINAYQGNERINGAFGSQMVDYYTHKEFGSGDHICYHGVYDMFRLPKPAAKVYQSQIAETPYLEFLNHMDIGDYDAGFVDAMYLASNCDSIDLYQNDRFVGTFKPNTKDFPHLKHPLYIIDDFYGDAYQKQGYTDQEAEELKELARETAKRGGLDKILDEEHKDWTKVNKAWQMYGKYVANWGSDAFTYKVIGHYQNQTIEKKIGPYQNYHYEIHADTNHLIHKDTYDVTRIIIEAIDNLGQPRPYAFDSFKLESEGSIEVIGEHYVSLIGGKRAVWIKTRHEGSGLVKIINDKTSVNLEFHVTK